MHELFKEIMSIGFDLDQTLYPKNPKIDNIIRESIAIKILERESELKNIKEAVSFYEKRYEKVGSGIQVLKNLGYNDAREIMNVSLYNPKILDLLKKDRKLVNLLENIHKKYETFLITSSSEDIAIKKLEKIGINPKLFNISIFGDTLNAAYKKLDGSVFKYFLSQSSYNPEQHVYVGDSFNADIAPAKSLGMKTIAIGKNIPEAYFSIEKIYDLESIFL